MARPCDGLFGRHLKKCKKLIKKKAKKNKKKNKKEWRGQFEGLTKAEKKAMKKQMEEDDAAADRDAFVEVDVNYENDNSMFAGFDYI